MGMSLVGRLLRRGQEREQAARGDANLCCGESSLDVVHRAEGDDAELTVGGQGLHTGSPDLDVWKIQGAHGVAEEGSLFVLGFGEGDLKVGAKESDGQAGEAGSGSEVKERHRAGGRGSWIQVAGGEEALAKVTADDLFRIADGGEVGAGVPFEEEVEVGGELVDQRRGGIG